MFLCAFLWLIASSCTDLQKPKIEQFYGGGEIKPPKKQEFRWANGALPKQLDPALAAAPPETDLVRAVYEGLTELDPQTLDAKAGVAEGWEVSADSRTWTFHLRKDAKWSNGRAVTARDFARSWRRLAEMGMAVPHSKLLLNIVGAKNFSIDDGISVLPPEEFEDTNENKTSSNSEIRSPAANANSSNAEMQAARPQTQNSPEPVKPPVATEKKTSVQKWLGVEAVDDLTLRVWLVRPDPNFAAAAAHPVFSPVYQDADADRVENLDTLERAPKAVTNGAFHIAAVSAGQVELARSDLFWGNETIALDKVFMIAKPDGESALAAYQANEVDAVTNTHFEPLALKLLTPYQDFRRARHNALTFYQFNSERKPFDDARVRKALAMSIERDRLVQDELDGAGEAALDLLPFGENEKGKLKENVGEAKKLLAEAGFSDLSTFPKVRLLVNRNDLQRRLANSVKKMWKKNLGISVEIIIKDRAEYEEAVKNGDYDLARRGVVLPTTDGTASLLAMFDPMPENGPENGTAAGPAAANSPENPVLPESNSNSQPAETGPENKQKEAVEKAARELQARAEKPQSVVILTEDMALEKLPAIPLYYPISYSLVKPYVNGFDSNLVDAPSLKTVVINDNWKNAAPQK